ncbi:putative regulatory subunit of protein kinase a-like protein [Trypanosoma grayi]|uniref:putative regulatory subunit of protein kinase a-like protein n=1 Tax=Trypanosoma grayi TaxID=71804 RepID=UPI0004F4527C|nr:putative regulatory subunit of protein kinase a-like protein [Trypanosoma grayi]KEG10011.1 putative regulatory subunit of protein kinase a-like protein [Trypanosoma grayi]
MSEEPHGPAASDSEDGATGAKFALSQGAGTPLGQLPAVQAVSNRGAACKLLETRLEPLHRLVFGRAGKAGERRRALEPFCGFPADMQKDITEKLHKLKKERLRDLIQALGMPVHISKPHAQVADDVARFLMQPHSEEKRKTPVKPARPSGTAAKRERTTSPSAVGRETKLKKETAPAAAAADAATGGTGVEEKSKRTEKRAPVAGKPSQANAPSDDAIRVAVYKRILSTPRGERSNLTTKALRLELEQYFGDLEARKAVIKEAASECVSALVAAEEAAAVSAVAVAAAAAAAAAAPTPAARSNGSDHIVEPSPAPQPPQPCELPMSSTDAAAAAVARSRPPLPETPDGSVAPYSTVHTFPAHPPTTVPNVSVPSLPPPGAPVV